MVKYFLAFLLICDSLFATAPWANAQTLRQQRQDNINIIDTNLILPRAGADEIGVKFITELSDSTSFTTSVYLIGLKNNKILWKKRFPLQEDINPPKTWISCQGQTVELHSQFPFTAAACIQTFSWDGDTLRFVSMVRGLEVDECGAGGLYLCT